MAFSGAQIDHYVRKFTDVLLFQLQQNGSVLRGTVELEQGMGDKVYFDRLGAVSSYLRTNRNEAKQIVDQTFERRYVSPQTIEFNTTIDLMDLVRYSSSPQSDLVKAANMKLGRDIDNIIITALLGTANREVNGSASNISFATSTNQTAATFIGYTSLSSGTYELHEGMILNAKQILETQYVDTEREPLFVVANAKQLAHLQSRIKDTNIAYRQDMGDLDIPGLAKGLDGIFGCRYIHSEMIPQVSSQDQVLMFVPSAAKLGIWKDLAVDVHKRYDLASNPDEVTVNMTMGAVRMDELRIVSILCGTS